MRINVRTITPSQFNPPAGCKPEEVIASWYHAQQIVDREDKEFRRHQMVAARRQICVKVLSNWGLSDDEAFKQVKALISIS